ncbi:MAG: hypothetical protein ACREQV_12110, partial [Candidatus Binatia bacterium]
MLNVEGFITRALHDEFWASVPNEIRKDTESRSAFLDFVERTVAAGLSFQRESWASMKASLAARKVVKTPGYEPAKRAVLASSNLREYQAQVGNSIENAEAMISAAAFGTPVRTPRGPIYVTEEMINQVLGGLDGSIARFRKLADPVWAREAEERRYPEAHVRILSETPFSTEVERLIGENGRPIRSVMLINRHNETDFVSVTFSDIGVLWADPDGAVLRTAVSALTGAGVLHPRVASSQWRQHRSAFGSGSTETSQGTVHASV